jgi:uncharacterized membrane protein YdfJ with MMPL/SSD domain
MTEPQNLAGRAGRWSAARWKTATFGWLAFAIVAVVVGSAVGLNAIADSETGSGETARAEGILADANFQSPATESVLVQSSSQTIDSPSFQAAVGTVVSTLSKQKSVTNIRSPFEHADGQVSADKHSALVQFDVKGKADDADAKIQPIIDAVAQVHQGNPGFRIEEFGLASANHELTKVFDKDFKRAEYTSLPITLVILLIAFGAFVAAGVPVLLAFSAVLAAIGLSSLVSHVFPMADFINNVILMIGMAVGVDYSLFYLQREREERRRGADPHRALLTAAGTSGQAVLISGATVLIAMAGMFFAGNKIFTSMAIGTMMVVFVAMIGSLTVLPALLHRLGDKIDKGRIPFVGRQRTERRAWSWVINGVLRRPAMSVVLSGAVLVALALPAFQLHTKLPGFTDLPQNLAIVKTFDRIDAAFPGSPAPATVVVKAADVTDPKVQDAVASLRRAALASGQMKQPITTRISPDKSVETVDIPLVGTGDDDTSFAALKTLRTELLPATLGHLGDGAEYAVTGQTAGTKDFNDQMKNRAPIVFAFVLGLAFLLLLLTFRSIVIPLKAIVLNLLSVGAAYGILVLVFQHTWAEGILGFRSNFSIASWLPLFLFVILFGLSMDYHVFILSRIKELVDKGERTEDAIAKGIVATAGTVTSAALVMVGVFAIFATLSVIDIKQMGFGLAVAVLLDATIIRAVLLPATMKLLGEWNWYLPTWLEWLPSLSPEAERQQVPDAPPATEAV